MWKEVFFPAIIEGSKSTLSAEKSNYCQEWTFLLQKLIFLPKNCSLLLRKDPFLAISKLYQWMWSLWLWWWKKKTWAQVFKNVTLATGQNINWKIYWTKNLENLLKIVEHPQLQGGTNQLFLEILQDVRRGKFISKIMRMHYAYHVLKKMIKSSKFNVHSLFIKIIR